MTVAIPTQPGLALNPKFHLSLLSAKIKGVTTTALGSFQRFPFPAAEVAVPHRGRVPSDLVYNPCSGVSRWAIAWDYNFSVNKIPGMNSLKSHLSIAKSLLVTPRG